MAITLNAITLPQGLLWEEEFTWSPLAQATEYSLTGALIVEQAIKQAGRPMTLIGGKDFAWITRAQVAILKALLDTGAVMTLTLHDARTFSVLPASDNPLSVYPLPRILDSGFADGGNGAWYVVESIKLIEV